MAITNPDGSVYSPVGSLQQFDPENPEHDLFNSLDQEIIQIAGSPIFYYEVFIDANMIDPLYVEARGKIYSNTPIQLYCYYEPIPSQNFIGTFGVDSPNEMLFEFNYRDVLNRLGHPPKVGARLFTPHKSENWMIKQRNVEVFKLWGELRLQLLCDQFTENFTTGEGKVTQQQTAFRIN